MTDKSASRLNTLAFLATLPLSALVMLWLLWHYPRATILLTLAALVALRIGVRLAQSTDTERGDVEGVGSRRTR